MQLGGSIARQEAVEQLAEAKQEAEAATAAKSRFLAMMSHEIRTPMNGVLGMLQLLDDGELSEEKHGLARTARTSAEALIQIIGDVLDFSKIEAGRLDIERVPFDPAEAIESVVTLLGPRAEEKGIELTSRIEADVPRAVLGDPGRIRQILLNLVENAVKFTEQGGVTVTLRPAPGVADTLHFSVQDTGLGISEEAQGGLFTEFTQSDASTTRRYGGTGLGLAICKRLVALMAGEIGLESTEGSGSTLWFRLPLAPTEDVPVVEQPVAAPVTVTGARILVVDDVRTNRLVTTAMLGKAGYEVETACDGREGVAAVQASDYDLVLMDLNMPGMDGIEAMTALRRAGEDVPILALTASALADVGELPGFDGHLEKPIRLNVLLGAVARAPGAEVVAETTQEGAPSDRTLDRAALRGFLEDVGAEVFPQLVDTYLEVIRGRISGLPEELEASRHDIRSCAGTLGASELHKEAAALEKAGSESDAGTAATLVPRVIDLAAEALPLVESLRDELAG